MKSDRESLQALQFAGSSIDITPQKPVPLAGYAGRTQAFESVSSPLEANAVLLSGDGTTLLFVSLDLMYCGPDVLSFVQQQARRSGLTDAQIVVTASHTHFAPATDRSKPSLGAVDDGYLEYLLERLKTLLETVLSAPLASVSLHWSQADTDLNISRRRRWRWPTWTREGVRLGPSVVMAPDSSGPRDGTLDALRLIDTRGRTAALLWKYACHPVYFPQLQAVSAEFPGHVRTRIRAELDSSLPVVFWQGFGGDTWPRLGVEPTLTQRLQALRKGPAVSRVEMPQWSEWAHRLAEAVIASFAAPEEIQTEASLSASSVEIDLSALIDVPDSRAIRERSLRIQHVAFGSKHEALFFSAEVCSPYARRLRGKNRILAAYAGDVFGYLPSEEQAREGGYEARGFFRGFGLEGSWRPGFERTVLDAAESLTRIESDS